jgi:hypothetical protein
LPRELIGTDLKASDTIIRLDAEGAFRAHPRKFSSGVSPTARQDFAGD